LIFKRVCSKTIIPQTIQTDIPTTQSTTTTKQTTKTATTTRASTAMSSSLTNSPSTTMKPSTKVSSTTMKPSTKVSSTTIKPSTKVSSTTQSSSTSLSPSSSSQTISVFLSSVKTSGFNSFPTVVPTASGTSIGICFGEFSLFPNTNITVCNMDSLGYLRQASEVFFHIISFLMF
jgi:hypothetical protein